MRRRSVVLASRCVAFATVLAVTAGAPSPLVAQWSTRAAILQAEDRRAPTAADLATLRSGARSRDSLTARMGLRALGRLERPSVVADITIGLQHALPEVRAEAANAVAQALDTRPAAAADAAARQADTRAAVTTAQHALLARLAVEASASVRAALAEAVARLPYVDTSDVARTESALVELADRGDSIDDRLGVAKGFEALVRLHGKTHRLSASARELLERLAGRQPLLSAPELAREARIRRLAFEALALLDTPGTAQLTAAATDPDAQVRRLAMRAAVAAAAPAVASRGLTNPAAMVRLEALRSLRVLQPDASCAQALSATKDDDAHVAHVALDALGGCASLADAVTLLDGESSDLAASVRPRGWHRFSHALIALAAAAPERAAARLPAFAASPVWQLRVAAARAAALIGNVETLARLARDAHDNVVEAAVAGLTATVRHGADEIFAAALERDGDQVVRVAARALAGSPAGDPVVRALQTALKRWETSPRPGAVDVRAAIRQTLASLGAPAGPAKPLERTPAPLTADELKRLAAPRARITMQALGTIDVALLTTEAPATVLQFVQLATSGYYNGLSFHRVVPFGIVQGGSPGANEFLSNAPLMRDEVGQWPHVRGALGISTRGRDTGDAQFFVDLVDNPRYDHTYTVFGQVLTGMDVVDRLLEGDIIESVEIIP